MNVLRLGWCLTAFAMLASCSQDDSPSRISAEEFSAYIAGKKIGDISTGSDYWLEKKVAATLDTWGKVALVFGYVENFEPCKELATYFEQSYPDNRYRCVPANYYPPKLQ